MSYFEELWNINQENDNFPQAATDDIFSLNPQESSHNLKKTIENTERNFFRDLPQDKSPHQSPLRLDETKNENIDKSSIGGTLKVLGIGGAGCNAINRMIEDNVSGVEFVAINTDVQVLKKSLAKTRIPIGSKITRGLGAGAKPEIGEKSAVESTEEICKILQNTDMAFITAGMGGGTGTGGTPIIAQIAKEMGCLVVAVVTLPFQFEGSKRYKAALEGLEKLKDHVDTLLVISNSRIFEIVEKNTSVRDAFKKIDEVLKQAVQGISGIISETAIINVDFNDVKTILSNRGEAIMGIGQAKGENRAIKAAQDALSNPLIENNTFRHAGAMVAKIIGGSDFDMKEFNEAAEAIAHFCRPDAEIIMGLDFDENLRDQVRIIIIATDLIRDFPQNNELIEDTPIQQNTFVSNSTPQKAPSQMNYAGDQNKQARYSWDYDSTPEKKPTSSHKFPQERYSIDVDLQNHQNTFSDQGYFEARRSVSEIPTIASELDTPAFLRRKKRILIDSRYQNK